MPTDDRMNPRAAGHALTESLRCDPAFSCYGFDDDNEPTTLIVYAWRRMAVPATFGGWPVVLKSIKSVRFEAAEES